MWDGDCSIQTFVVRYTCGPPPFIVLSQTPVTLVWQLINPSSQDHCSGVCSCESDRKEEDKMVVIVVSKVDLVWEPIMNTELLWKIQDSRLQMKFSCFILCEIIDHDSLFVLLLSDR